MSSALQVPLVDLRLQHERVAAPVQAAINDVVRTTSFIGGPHVEAFEGAFARYCGANHCVGVGNGTDAVELALRAIGIGVGDEVIIPANTFVATAEGVLRAGATVVLADCDEDFLLDPDSVAKVVTRRTKAVVPVHLYGQLAPTAELRAAVGESVLIVEDAAQSQGAARNGQRSGSFGAVAATSFYPGKNLGAYGDAGAVTTSSEQVAERIKALRNHGGIAKYEHRILGLNSRLDGIQAAVLSVKLQHLDRWNQERRSAAERYQALLGDLPDLVLPQAADPAAHVWHLYVVRVLGQDEGQRRNRVLGTLQEAGVGAALHYPAPIHRLPAFSYLQPSAGTLGRTETFASQILSLPIFPGITADQQDYVAQQFRHALQPLRQAERV